MLTLSSPTASRKLERVKRKKRGKHGRKLKRREFECQRGVWVFFATPRVPREGDAAAASIGNCTKKAA